MAISETTSTRFIDAMAQAAAANEMLDAINASTAALGSANLPGASVATITTATAVDLPSAEALANQLKTTVNALIAALVAAGVIA
jgi:hypothetical protein